MGAVIQRHNTSTFPPTIDYLSAENGAASSWTPAGKDAQLFESHAQADGVAIALREHFKKEHVYVHAVVREKPMAPRRVLDPMPREIKSAPSHVHLDRFRAGQVRRDPVEAE